MLQADDKEVFSYVCTIPKGPLAVPRMLLLHIQRAVQKSALASWILRTVLNQVMLCCTDAMLLLCIPGQSLTGLIAAWWVLPCCSMTVSCFAQDVAAAVQMPFLPRVRTCLPTLATAK